MNDRKLVMAAGVLLSATGLLAQSGGFGVGVAAGGGRAAERMQFQSAGTFGTVTTGASYTRTSSSTITGPLTVANRAFSATEERKSVQTLGDGTEISNAETNLIYRDSQGRIRVEQTTQGKTVIAIMDPVARAIIRLDPDNKTARKSAIPEGVDEGGITITGGAVSTSFGTSSGARTMSPRATTGAPAPNVVMISGIMSSTLSAGAAAGGGGGGVATAKVSAANVKNEELGVQQQNGVLATGNRSTMTIPQGQIGNNRDIHVVNERWYSDDLQMLVKSVNSDPRFGETTYQLTNVSRVEPDPTLFQIPVGYTELVSNVTSGFSFTTPAKK